MCNTLNSVSQNICVMHAIWNVQYGALAARGGGAERGYIVKCYNIYNIYITLLIYWKNIYRTTYRETPTFNILKKYI